MFKDFITGAIPLGLFLYLCVFQTTAFVVLFVGFGLTFASYCIGAAIRGEWYRDRN